MDHKSSINSLINVALHCGDCLSVLSGMESGLVDCCVTSPPYFGLRDYGVDGQIGLEQTPDEYVAKLVEVFREVKRVLRDDGTLWLNIGDSYVSKPTGSLGTFTGEKHGFGSSHAHQKAALERPDKSGFGLLEKNLIGIPWRVAFALQADGWYLRQDIIWHKPNPMPESVRDRCTKAHEYVFLLSKSPKYFYDFDAMQEPATCAGTRPSAPKGAFKAKGEPMSGQFPFRAVKDTRNRRSVWTVATKPYKGAHFATFPPSLIEPCVLAGSRRGGTVLDPFNGSGTTGEVAILNGRKYIGIELNPEYIQLAEARISTAVKQYESHAKQQEFDFGIAT